MKHIVPAIFILVGIVNFLPVLGVLGAFIIASAFRDSWRNLAAAAGLLSMLSFILLALPLSAHGAELQRVFWIDVIACVLLAFGCWRHNR